MNQIKILACVSLAWLLMACAGSPKTEMTLVIPDDNYISFTGKGAGAGMALMSTMGPVGVAIGLAIDEGIAKEIRSNLGVDQGTTDELAQEALSSVCNCIVRLVKPAVDSEPDENTPQNLPINEMLARIRINSIAFSLVNGSDEEVAVKISATLSGTVETQEFSQVVTSDIAGNPVTLEAIRTNKPIAMELLNKTYSELFMNIFKDKNI